MVTYAANPTARHVPITLALRLRGLKSGVHTLYRHELRGSARNFVTLGLPPALGGLALIGVFVKAFLIYHNPANDVSKPLLGVGVPVWIGVGLLVVGLVLALALRIPYPAFIKERRLVAGDDFETVAPDVPPAALADLVV